MTDRGSASDTSIGAVFPLTASRSLVFQGPAAVLEARVERDVAGVLAEVEAATRRGLWAAGFVAYEAAPAFDAALATLPPAPLPLAWFALFTAPRWQAPPRSVAPAGAAGREWTPSIGAAEHAAAVAGVREAIARGDTYQVNLTWRLRAALDGSPRALFDSLLAAQPVRYAAYLDMGRHVLCSASPELFIRRRGTRLSCRPMKGTAARGRYPAEDQRIAAALAASPKERAENLMIVDMVRNDLARVARPGTVTVPRLWQLERYATVWQLTSTVAAESAAPLPELMRALFPAASITGAPKASSMRLIAALEDSPRGAYCGAIGWVGPGGRARFNVAIRTAWVDRDRGVVEYGTGGGVTWDSTPAAELAESRLKATLLLAPPRPPFELLETLLWRPGRGYWLLREHLERLRASARHFGFRYGPAVERQLLAYGAALPAGPQRVRLRLDADGAVAFDATPMAAAPRDAAGRRRPWRVALAAAPVDVADPLLFHKTTRRAVYEAARASRPGCDDVLLWNARGEVTESTIANLVVRLAGRLVTPPVECGLLAGTLRRRLLARGTVVEGVVRVADLAGAEGLWLVNGVRGCIRAELVAGAAPAAAAAPGRR